MAALDQLRSLVADHGDYLLKMAYQLTHDGPAAQDLVQEALLAVVEADRRRDLTITHPLASASAPQVAGRALPDPPAVFPGSACHGRYDPSLSDERGGLTVAAASVVPLGDNRYRWTATVVNSTGQRQHLLARPWISSGGSIAGKTLPADLITQQPRDYTTVEPGARAHLSGELGLYVCSSFPLGTPGAIADPLAPGNYHCGGRRTEDEADDGGVGAHQQHGLTGHRLRPGRADHHQRSRPESERPILASDGRAEDSLTGWHRDDAGDRGRGALLRPQCELSGRHLLSDRRGQRAADGSAPVDVRTDPFVIAVHDGKVLIP